MDFHSKVNGSKPCVLPRQNGLAALTIRFNILLPLKLYSTHVKCNRDMKSVPQGL